jgi:predicted amidohydrolase
MYTTDWSSSMRLAVAQIISSADLAANLELIREYATEAKAAGAELVVFPEASMRAFGHSLKDIAEPLDGPWAEKVRGIARELDIAIVAGMFTP